MSHSLVSLVRAHCHDGKETQEENDRRRLRREMVELLVSRYLNRIPSMVVFWQHRYKNQDMDYRVSKALYIAAYTYKRENNLSFYRWWQSKIRGTTSNGIRNEARRGKHPAMRRLLAHNRFPMELVDISRDAPVASDHVLPSDMLDTIKRLPDQEQQAVHLYYYMGFTDGEIAEFMGVTRARANQIRHRAIRMLRKIADR